MASFWTRLMALLRAVFGWGDEPEPDPKPEEPDRPALPIDEQLDGVQRYSWVEGEQPVATIAIHSTQRIVDEKGRLPEIAFAVYLSRALEKIEQSYQITINHEAYDAPETELGNPDPVFDWWHGAAAVEPIAKDANLLLDDLDGGGLSFVGGRFGVGPARNIINDIQYAETGTGPHHANIHACLHEVIHMLGVRHDFNRTRPGMQHPGIAWNDDQEATWHRTPEVAGNGYPNICGESIPVRRFNQVVRHQYYHDCSRDYLDIKPDG